MDHNQARELIHPYADGELDTANAHQVAQHLGTCPECRLFEQQVRALRTALTSSAPAFRAPGRLRKNVRAALRKEARSQGEATSGWFWFALPAAALALLLIGFGLFRSFNSDRNRIADEVVADHVRSLLATHLVDVASSDQHTVKPWFNGKVDFAPEVQDFSAEGFPLIGGRLDYLDGKTVVALVYRRNQHPINLLIAPASGKRDSPPSGLSRRGYNIIHWTHEGMDYWAVSDLNAADLGQLPEKFLR